MRVHVPRIPYGELRAGGLEPSRVARGRVVAARERMRARLAGTARRCNAELTVGEIRRLCRLAPDAEALVAEAVASRRLSARAVHRTLRVARTVADLAASDAVSVEHLALALLLRAQP